MTICKNEGNCSVSERERDPQYYGEKTSPTDYLPEMTKPLQHRQSEQSRQ